MNVKKGIAIILGLTAVASLAKPAKKVAPAGIGSILFVGDSNTALPFSYAHQLQASFPGIRIKIIAKIGSQTSWMYGQLTKELATAKYDVISILGGSNDLYATDSISAAKSNLDKMYAAARSSGAKVLAISPPNKNFFVRRTPHKQELLHQLVKWIQANKQPTWFIDFYTLTDNKAFFTRKDGYLHAQQPAHEILSSGITETLNLSLNAKS